jgi:Rod binding domain-containing protein
MMSFGVQTLATSMAASGGIGIGKMIAKAMHAALTRRMAQAQSLRPAPGKVHQGTNEKVRAGLELCV